MTQNERILRRLKRKPVTPLVALRELGVMRLSARILDLRKQGHDIQRRMIARGGKRYAVYWL